MEAVAIPDEEGVGMLSNPKKLLDGAVAMGLVAVVCFTIYGVGFLIDMDVADAPPYRHAGWSWLIWPSFFLAWAALIGALACGARGLALRARDHRL